NVRWLRLTVPTPSERSLHPCGGGTGRGHVRNRHQIKAAALVGKSDNARPRPHIATRIHRCRACSVEAHCGKRRGLMKFTLSWLKEHLDTDEPLDRIVDKLTMIGLEVESVEDKAKALAP